MKTKLSLTKETIARKFDIAKLLLIAHLIFVLFLLLASLWNTGPALRSLKEPYIMLFRQKGIFIIEIFN